MDHWDRRWSKIFTAANPTKQRTGMPHHDPTIHCVKLKGHQKAVLCLNHSSSSNRSRSSSSTGSYPLSASCNESLPLVAGSLLSGSEDGTARLWDLRDTSNIRASLCIQSPRREEVVSVVFGPPLSSSASSPQPLTAIGTPNNTMARDYSVFLATGTTVYGYDLRMITGPIVTQPSSCLAFLGSEDEVNQIAFAPVARISQPNQRSTIQQRKPLLACVDDEGMLRMTESIEVGTEDQSDSPPNKRVYLHAEDTMVTTLAFRPRVKGGIEIVTGGSDCRILLWDAVKDRSRPLSTLFIPSSDTGANQLCNPPMVNHLSWSPSGRLLAASLGDGSVGLLQAENRSLVMIDRLHEAHNGAVASAIFPQWLGNPSDPGAITADDRLLCSVGNDGALVLWDLGASICGDKAESPRERFFPPTVDLTLEQLSIRESTPPTAAAKAPQATSTVQGADHPQALFAWTHGWKPNWMESSRNQDPLFPNSIFVADVSKDISIYSVR